MAAPGNEYRTDQRLREFREHLAVKGGEITYTGAKIRFLFRNYAARREQSDVFKVLTLK